MDNLKDRFDSALKAVRKAGITAQRNVMGCCRSCISGEGKHDETQPIIWHFGGQGNRFIIEGNRGYYYKDKWSNNGEVAKIYFNHDNLHNEDGTPNVYGQKVLAIFAQYGLVIDEDFSPHRTLTVDLRRSVPHRTDEEQAWLINTCLDKYNLWEWFKTSYRVQRFIHDLWDKSYKTDEQWDEYFAKERAEIDETEKRERERAEYRAKLDKGRSIKGIIIERVKPNALTESQQALFTKWIDYEVLNLQDADAEPVAVDNRVANFLEHYIGDFDSLDDFFEEHLAGWRALPQWAKDNIQTGSVWREQFAKGFFYQEYGSWSNRKVAVIRQPEVVGLNG